MTEILPSFDALQAIELGTTMRPPHFYQGIEETDYWKEGELTIKGKSRVCNEPVKVVEVYNPQEVLVTCTKIDCGTRFVINPQDPLK